MRSFRFVLPQFLFLIAAAGWGQQEPVTDAQRDGFLGPVKSVSTTVSNLGVKWQQPGGPTLVMPIWCRDCEYDPDGAKTKSGQVTSDGRFAGETILLDRDGSGHVTGQHFVSALTGEVSREVSVGPYGRTEETDTINGKVRYRQIIGYDQNGHMSDWLTLNSDGNQESETRTVTAKDGTVTERSVWEKDGQLQYRDTFDPDKEVEHFTTYDESGGVKVAFTVDHGKPVSFWAASDATPQFGDSFSLDKGSGDRDHFVCHQGGQCDRFAVHYEYLDLTKKRDPTTAEWRDSQGNLLYAAYCEYEVDAFKNWTHRRVWVKSGAGERALYEEDSRTIGYWPDPSQQAMK
jgi:hypothetical protein